MRCGLDIHSMPAYRTLHWDLSVNPIVTVIATENPTHWPLIQHSRIRISYVDKTLQK